MLSLLYSHKESGEKVAIPSIRKILPFPATEDYTVYFDVSGISQQIYYNELEIKLSSDTSQVFYNERIQEFRYEHTIPFGILSNGNQYVAVIRIYDNTDTLIGESNPVFFYCLSEPLLAIPTIINNEVLNQTVTFRGTYIQAEGELLQSYKFILYNDNKNEITQSPEMFSDKISYEFSDLVSRAKYYIELKIATTNEMEATTGLIEFTPRYIAPRFASSIEAENLDDEASILVTCNIVRMIGTPTNTITYVDGMADMTDNLIYFDKGFSLKNDFTLMFWVKDVVPNSVFFNMTARDGSNLKVEYKNNRFNLIKTIRNDYIIQKLLGYLDVAMVDNIAYIFIQHVNGMYDFDYNLIEQVVE